MGQLKRGRPRGKSTRYIAIAAEIGEKMAAGEWPVGHPLPSLRELARRHRVSFKTIHRAFALLKSRGQLHVRPHRVALAALGAPLEGVLRDAIAVVLPQSLTGSWQGQFWNGIAHGAKKLGATLVVLQDDERWKTEFPAGLRDAPLRGVLLVGPFRPGLLRQYESLGLPVVLLDQPGEDYQFHSVSVANYDAAYDATARLIAMGHRRIAFIGYILPSLLTVEPDARQRQLGFAAACKAKGLKDGDYRSFLAGTSHATQAIQALHAANPPFTAVITSKPMHAEQVFAAAKARGQRIPRDLSLVTFHVKTSDPMQPDWSGPRLDLDQFGIQGVELLVRNPRTPQHVLLTPVWHDGKTTAPKPKRK